jgi:glycine/D-amino acid oxidase-like deaminating enzyme
MTRTNADAVVIGAGHHGLVAAIVLADAGWDVVVLEASRTWAAQCGRQRGTQVSPSTGSAPSTH